MSEKKILILSGIVLVVGLLVGVNLIAGSGSSGSGTNTQDNNQQVSLTTNPNPPTTGDTTFIVSVKDKNGKPVDNAKVNFNLNMTSMNMGSQQGSATSQGNGNYSAVGKFSMGGPWRISTQVTMPNGSALNKDFDFNVQ